jgi:hypothetical protein
MTRAALKGGSFTLPRQVRDAELDPGFWTVPLSRKR